MITRLERALDYRFDRPELLSQALTHRSHSSPHNERLEFLGDSILNCVIAGLLFERFPALREGELSRLRANLVRQETLADIALSLDLGGVVRLGEGELKSGGFRRPSILADALEAIFGAIYLESGFASAHSVVEHLFTERLGRIDPRENAKDAKTALQEWLQGRRLPLPQYDLAETRGEAHSQEFIVHCRIEKLDLRIEGRGASRRAAEQDAARATLAKITQS